MALSDDQRALLRLLAQREEGYGDIAALMGLSVDEVRARVKEALAALNEEVEAPAGRAERPPLLDGPAQPGRETKPLRPKPPERTVRPSRPDSHRVSPATSRRRLFELAGGAVVAILLVLFATGVVNLGGDDSGSDGSDTAASPAETAGAEGGKLTQAVLEPLGGGDASGRALFGRLGKEVVLQVVAEELEPTAPGESYTVWLYRSPKLSLRVGAVKVGEAGQLGARFPVPAELLAFVANGAFTQIYLSRTSNAAYEAEAARAKQQQRLPSYTGETVLRGEITGPLANQ